MEIRTCVAAIIEKDKKVLLGKKPKNTYPYPNTWVLIGGGVRQQKETLEQALRREIKEEANIEVKNLKQLCFNEDYEPNKFQKMTHYINLIYTAEYKSGKIKPADDIAEIKLFNKAELKKLKLPKPSVKLFKDLGWL